MTEEQITKLSREQLYNEIWEISVAGVAKKYNVPYVELIKLCREKDIPCPPSGYWTRLKYGKDVTKTPLPESSIIEVSLPANSVPKRSRRTAEPTDVDDDNKDTQIVENLDSNVKAMEKKEVLVKQQAAEELDSWIDLKII